jgi:hypothetical protein
MTAKSSWTLSELLEEQYQRTEAFANAQTRLWNVTTKSKNGNASSLLSTSSAVRSHSKARRDVQEILKCLQENQGLKERHSKHFALSQRVIKTIANNPSWHANGVPNTHADPAAMLEANTVAMAALKASIASILQDD